MELQLKVPPVAQGLAAAFLLWVLHRFIPFYHLQFIHQTAMAVILAVVGLVVAVSSIQAFIQSKTTVDPRTPEKATTLVVIGIYKYSRNPMYLGILLVLMGIATWLGAVSNIVVITGFVMFINRFQIKPEEIALTDKFGETYTQYVQNVGRWL